MKGRRCLCLRVFPCPSYHRQRADVWGFHPADQPHAVVAVDGAGGARREWGIRAGGAQGMTPIESPFLCSLLFKKNSQKTIAD